MKVGIRVGGGEWPSVRLYQGLQPTWAGHVPSRKEVSPLGRRSGFLFLVMQRVTQS